ncbi:MAG: glycosyl hydrolase, partial [Bacteroidetes bacterium]
MSADRGYPEDPPFLGSGVEWVDSVMAGLNLEQRISQMIMVAAYSRQGDVNVKQLERLVSKEGIGGLIFFQGNPVKQANLSNRLQSLADVPLLIAMDAENGLGMRLDSCVTYPPQMILGALGGDAAIYRMGRDMARQMKRLGVHMNLAPVADVNNNPLNPVIHTRSFGSDPSGVSKKVVALVRGMQDQHILVAAKHFPGHGDTETDSHHALPRIDHAPVHLDSVELRPFREAIKAGITGIMSGHLEVPAMEADPGRASSMSASIIRGVLRDKLEFRGLVVTDALNMRSLSALPADGSRALEAVKAGNDILLMPSNVPAAVTAIKRALKRGEIREATINASCRRILEAKYWAGAHH